MKSALCTILMVILCSFHCYSTFAIEKGNSGTVSSSYGIRSLGSTIGTVSAKMSGTATDNDLRADVDVNVSFLFFSFSLKSTETTSIRGGKMIRYRKTIDTGGDHREITGELDGDMVTILIRDGEKVERKVFSAKIYEATNMEYPEVTLAPGETRKMKVLDLENAEVVDRVYRYVAEEQAKIDGRIIRIIVADFSDKNSECRRWTAIIDGLPVVRRQDGKEKTGLFNPSYSVRQTKVAIGQ
ncbi:MAG: DUF3108 domain-containing protein [Deltaproteobacteria bacterium]|nr:DUF3108 domain-containing protein [Deltaproteobacteria bacterium]